MQRASGILLHPTALASALPVGDLGEQAFSFVDFLSRAGQSVWQVLPLGPTGYGHSPYNTLSAFAGNPVLVDLTQLVHCGDLDQEKYASVSKTFPELNLDQAHELKHLLLRDAARNFLQLRPPERFASFTRFCRQNQGWLEDFSLFMALKAVFY